MRLCTYESLRAEGAQPAFGHFFVFFTGDCCDTPPLSSGNKENKIFFYHPASLFSVNEFLRVTKRN